MKEISKMEDKGWQIFKLSAQANFFKGDLLKGIFISKAFHRIKDFNSSKLPFGVVISSNSFGEILGSYSHLFKSYIKNIYFRVVGNMHSSTSSLSKIVNINGYNHNFILFFHKNWSDLFGFVRFIIPELIKIKIFATFQSVQFTRTPLRSFNSFNNFFFSSSTKCQLAFSMLTEPNWFNDRLNIFLHLSNNTILLNRCQLYLEMLREYRNDPNVEYAEPNFIYRTQKTEENERQK